MEKQKAIENLVENYGEMLALIARGSANSWGAGNALVSKFETALCQYYAASTTPEQDPSNTANTVIKSKEAASMRTLNDISKDVNWMRNTLKNWPHPEIIEAMVSKVFLLGVEYQKIYAAQTASELDVQTQSKCESREQPELLISEARSPKKRGREFE